MSYQMVIGLEVHVQLKTASKLFSTASTTFGKDPNANTTPLCLGLPGTLPVLNRRVVDFAILFGLATGCTIAPKSVFARKNYFYPDLPKGYQISQYELPICQKGFLDIAVDGKQKRIGITRAHIEEDAGKLLHEHPVHRGSTDSWVDFNRAGIPLLEIVSEPDMRTPDEAIAYLKKLRTLVMYLDICDGNMEEGSLRCDANVSLRKTEHDPFGTRAELKNINSFKNIEKAILYEADRQAKILDEGGKIVQETRLWNADLGETFSMRSKEDAHDYRYFPDPDLLPLKIDSAWMEKIRKTLPELPDSKQKRYTDEWKLPLSDAQLLSDTRSLATFFEACVEKYAHPKQVANWIVNEYLRLLQTENRSIQPMIPEYVAEGLKAIEEGQISQAMGKQVLEKSFVTGKSPLQIIREEGLSQVSDEAALETIITKVLSAHPNEVDRYKKGDQKLTGFFMGQIMKETRGKANPNLLGPLLKRKLDS